MSILTKSSSHEGIAFFAYGDDSNEIIRIGTNANSDGEIKTNSSDGALSVRLSNESSRGVVETRNAAGDTTLSYMGSNANGGLSQTNDTDGNASVKAESDSSKRGKFTILNADGDEERYVAEVDSNDMGKLTIKDSSANASLKLESVFQQEREAHYFKHCWRRG